MSRRIFEPIRGRVFLQKNEDFLTQGEVLQDHGQLPAFEPRAKWAPSRNPRPLHIIPADIMMGPDSSQVFEAFKRQFPNLLPMPAFDNPARSYNETTWDVHAAWSLNQLLHVDEQDRTRLSYEHMQHLFIIASYGMSDSVSWLKNPFILGGPAASDNSNRRGSIDSVESDDFDMIDYEDPASSFDSINGFEMVDSENPSGSFYFVDSNQPTNSDLSVKELFVQISDANIGIALDGPDRRGDIENTWGMIHGKRWIVAPVNTDGHHWSASIFDRAKGHLVIFDTLPAGRDKRITAIAHAWALFWDTMGKPCHFHYFVPQTTHQPQEWECGYLCVQWVMSTLRDRAGERAVVSKGEGHVVDLDIFAPYQKLRDEYPLQPQPDHLHDWMPRNTYSAYAGLYVVMHGLGVMLCTELGLSPHNLMVDPNEDDEDDPARAFLDMSMI